MWTSRAEVPRMACLCAIVFRFSRRARMWNAYLHRKSATLRIMAWFSATDPSAFYTTWAPRLNIYTTLVHSPAYSSTDVFMTNLLLGMSYVRLDIYPNELRLFMMNITSLM